MPMTREELRQYVGEVMGGFGGLHWCEHTLPEGGYGPAIAFCGENEKGELWVENYEYASQVGWCPFCGYEAQVKPEGIGHDPGPG